LEVTAGSEVGKKMLFIFVPTRNVYENKEKSDNFTERENDIVSYFGAKTPNFAKWAGLFVTFRSAKPVRARENVGA
jgi:hypothetical protein